jgi:hypothetical protein
MYSHIGDEDDDPINANTKVGQQELEAEIDFGEDREYHCNAKFDRDTDADLGNNLKGTSKHPAPRA